MAEVEPEIQRLLELYFGEPDPSEAKVIEMTYSPEELAAMPELRARYESAKEDLAVAELAKILFVLEEYVSAEAAAKYAPLREQINKAVKAGKLSDRFTPAEFIAWVKDNTIAVPEGLKKAIKERNEMHNLRSRCDSISRERDAFSRECDQLRAALKESESRKLIITHRRLIYGMAQCKWGYDHRRGRSSVPREISAALGEKGISIHPDTIRDCLRAAIEDLPEELELYNQA